MIGGTFDPAELRGQENFLARHFGEHLADQLFGVAVAVRIGGVPVGDATAVRGDQRFLRQTIVVTAPADRSAFACIRAAVPPCAEADGRHVGVCSAETDGLHGSQLSALSLGRGWREAPGEGSASQISTRAERPSSALRAPSPGGRRLSITPITNPRSAPPRRASIS